MGSAALGGCLSAPAPENWRDAGGRPHCPLPEFGCAFPWRIWRIWRILGLSTRDRHRRSLPAAPDGRPRKLPLSRPLLAIRLCPICRLNRREQVDPAGADQFAHEAIWKRGAQTGRTPQQYRHRQLTRRLHPGAGEGAPGRQARKRAAAAPLAAELR